MPMVPSDFNQRPYGVPRPLILIAISTALSGSLVNLKIGSLLIPSNFIGKNQFSLSCDIPLAILHVIFAQSVLL